MTQLQDIRSKQSTLKVTLAAVLTSLFIVILLTYIALSFVKSIVLEEYGKSLDAVLDSNTKALLLWTSQQADMLEQLAESSELLSTDGKILDVQNIQNSAVLATKRAEMNRLQTSKPVKGFILLTPSGAFIASNIDMKIDQGMQTPISVDYSALISLANTQSTFVPPVEFSHNDDNPQVFLTFLTPIIKNQVTLGLIGALYSPDLEISEIAALGRIGESGETYLFDRNAMMVSRSRFETALRDLSLIADNQTSVLNLKLYDPGINMYQSSHVEPLRDQLTLMARSAIQGIKGSDTEGYRDYRGIKVIGAWQWIPSLNIGITTEVDLDEALQSYRSSRAVILMLLLAGLTIISTLGFFIVRISLRSTRKLLAAADELEEQVAQRTKALSVALTDLQSEQTVLQCLFDNIPDPIFCKDNEKRYIKGNHAFFQVFNRQPHEVIGFKDEDITHDNDKDFFKDTDQQVLDSGKTLIFERTANHENYQDRLFETRKSLIPFPGDHLPGIIAIARDITDQRNTEQTLIKASLAADAANRAKSEFLARMSHEIRTPMNGVIGMLDLVMDTPLSAEQKQRLDVAKSSANSLLGIINDILDFSRVEADKLDLDVIDFDLPRQIEDTARAIAIKAEAKGLELLVDVTAIKYAMVKGDPLRVRQILTNLINNAIKFTHQGQIHIVATTLEAEKRLSFICRVSDTGIGIPKSKLGKLFDSFTQVDSSTTRIYGGSGLGLAICKRLCQLMNGSVSVCSELGVGSTFTVDIELEKSDMNLKQLPQLDVSGLSVLVVDDNTINLDILTNQLGNIDLMPVCVSSADDALGLLFDKDRHFDLLITDMNMPEKDGLALVKEVRDSGRLPNLKVIMLSSMSFNASRNELKAQGLDGCLLKPVATRDLINVIKLVTDKNQVVDDLGRASSGVNDGGTINEQALLGFKDAHDNAEFVPPDYHHVLIVEDNPVNMMVAQGLMKKLGLRNSAAFNGQECLEKLQRSVGDDTFTLILMDCQMPILDGYDATSKIRRGEAGQSYASIPIIAMTANAMQGDKEKCLSYGMNFHVPKPIDTEHLKDVLIQTFAVVPSHLSQFEMPVSTGEEPDSATLNLKLPQQKLTTMDLERHPPSLLIDPKMYVKSLALFEQHYRHKQYQYPNQECAIAALKHDVHTLKGSAGNMGFCQIHAHCLSLEKKLAQSTLSPSDVAELNTLMARSLGDAQELLRTNKALLATKLTSKTAQALYKAILPFIENSEMVPNELVDELKSLAAAVDTTHEVHNVVMLLEQFDYAKLTSLIVKLK